MKFRTTIILAVVAIIGAAYVFLYEKKQVTVKEKYVQQKKIFFGLNADSIFKIKVKKNNKEFIFEKKSNISSKSNGLWIMEKPITTRADQAVINAFLSELEFLERVRHFQEDDKDAAKEDYGLDNPTFEINLWTSETLSHMVRDNTDKALQSGDIKEYSFIIGDRVSTGKHVYAQLQGSDEVLVLNDEIAMKLDFNENGFRDKWVLDIDVDAVSKIEIQRDERDTIFCAKDKELWRMEQPIYDRCDNKKIVEIINSLKDIKIEEEDFLTETDGSLVKYGLDNPKIRVIIDQEGYKQGIAFGHLIDNKVYAKRDNEKSVFMIKDLIVSELAIDPNILRSRKLVRFETLAGTFGVERIEIKTPETKISIKKTKEYDWQITEPVNVLADMDVVKELIEEVKDLRILDFVMNKGDYEKYGLKEPLFTLSIYKEMVDKPISILFGTLTKHGDQCYVKRLDEDPVFSITSKGIYEKLLEGLFAFQDKLVLEFNKELVNGIEIDKNDTTFLVEKSNKRKKSNWLLKKPIKGFPDDDLIDQMVQGISFLKAEKYVANMPVDLNEYGLDTPKIKVAILYQKPEKEINNNQNDSNASDISKTDGDNDNEQNKNVAKSSDIVAHKIDTVPLSTLLIGNKVSLENPNYFAMIDGSNTVFELNENVVNYFNSEIVSKSIQKFNAARAKRLVLSHSDKELVFERPEGIWKQTEPESGDVSSRHIEFLLWILSDLQAEQIVEYNLNNVISYGLAAPDIKATVYLDDESLFEVLAVNNNNKDYYVMSRNSNCIYTANKDVIDKLIE